MLKVLLVMVLVLWLLLGLCAIAACIVSGRFGDPDSLRQATPRAKPDERAPRDIAAAVGLRSSVRH